MAEMHKSFMRVGFKIEFDTSLVLDHDVCSKYRQQCPRIRYKNDEENNVL